MFSTWPFGRPSFVHLSVYYQTCATGQGDKRINFGSQKVKGQGHTMPKLDFEASFSISSVDVF